MTSKASQLDQVVQRLMERLGQSFSDPAAAPLSAVWRDRWKPRLQEIRKEGTQIPTAAIAVVGGTGAGKSTLLNAVLESRVLPVSNSRACTAAISEVTYSDGEFVADIEFISRVEWQREIDCLLSDLAEVKDDGEHTNGSLGAVGKAARDRLKAVYQLPEEQIQHGLKFNELTEPDDIRVALDTGHARVASESVEEFRKQLRRFLDSKDMFWPLVKCAKIKGPFPGLSHQWIKLVDLPGLNDPNEAREQVTRNHLKNCRFVWIVFNIKRAMTREIQTIMQSDDFARQLVLDGRDNSLTFIGTHSDDFDRDSSIEEFSLPDDASEAQVVLMRNSVARKEVCNQLRDLAGRIAQRAGEPTRTGELSDRLQKSRIFTVSAKDYLHLKAIAKNRSSTLEDTAETEIPALREHLAMISAAYTDGAHQVGLLKQVEQLISEIKHRLQTEIQNVAHTKEMSAKKRKEIRNALQRLLTFLGRDLEAHRESFSQDMNAKRELLEERLRRAFEKARAELQRVTDGWKGIHLSTLKAIVKRSGRYSSPTSGEHDFAEDIARPALEMIPFAWDDFFGDKMKHALTVSSDKLVTLADRHGIDTVREVIQHADNNSASLSKDLERSLSGNERIIKEYVGDCQSKMSTTLHSVRSNLYEQIPRQVAANMREAFAEAENESGEGMKRRILDLLAAHARRVSKVMFDDARDKIMDGVRMLTDTMSQSYGRMIEGVSERLAVPISNFLSDESQEVTGSSSVLSAILHDLELITKPEPTPV